MPSLVGSEMCIRDRKKKTPFTSAPVEPQPEEPAKPSWFSRFTRKAAKKTPFTAVPSETVQPTDAFEQENPMLAKGPTPTSSDKKSPFTKEGTQLLFNTPPTSENYEGPANQPGKSPFTAGPSQPVEPTDEFQQENPMLALSLIHI